MNIKWNKNDIWRDKNTYTHCHCLSFLLFCSFANVFLYIFQLHFLKKTCKRFIIKIIRFENDVPKHTLVQSNRAWNKKIIMMVAFLFSSILFARLAIYFIFIQFSIAILFTLNFPGRFVVFFFSNDSQFFFFISLFCLITTFFSPFISYVFFSVDYFYIYSNSCY